MSYVTQAAESYITAAQVNVLNCDLFAAFCTDFDLKATTTLTHYTANCYTIDVEGISLSIAIRDRDPCYHYRQPNFYWPSSTLFEKITCGFQLMIKTGNLDSVNHADIKQPTGPSSSPKCLTYMVIVKDTEMVALDVRNHENEVVSIVFPALQRSGR